MPGFVLHVGATVICAHGGQAKPATPNPRVQVSSQAIVTMVSPWTVTGCGMPPPSAGNGPCATAQFVSAAIRVLASGQPVLLQDSSSVCVPTGTPLVPTVVQPRVRAT
jgi:hypothetical protein